MTEQQKKNLEEVIFSMEVEGFDIPDDEKENLIGILDGKYTFKEILESYISEAKTLDKVDTELIIEKNFDYTKWQKDLFPNMSVRELSKVAMEAVQE